MRLFNGKLAAAIITGLALIGFATSASALEPTVVTFDDGAQGWVAGPDCQPVVADGGNPGADWTFANRYCDTNHWFARAFFRTWNDTNPAFIGDYTAKGPVRITVDVDITEYTYHGWWTMDVEEYRQLVVEFIDHDNPYTDPDSGVTWPWTSVIYQAGYFPNRDAGWKTFTIDIVDPSATEVPEGWVGFGGPEDTTTYMPQLPPDRTFADVMAGVDEIQIHSIEPGYFYGIGFTHDINFDNITIKELPIECEGQQATVYVDYDGIVHGGEFDGMPYDGSLVGTQGDDVIAGTVGRDNLQGLGGNDLMCGHGGNDNLHGGHGDDMMFGGAGDDVLTGQKGNDFLSGGEGRDTINGGPDSDTCIGGDVFKLCGQ